MRIKTYQSKEQESRFFREQGEECHLWLAQNLHPQNMSSIMSSVMSSFGTDGGNEILKGGPRTD